MLVVPVDDVDWIESANNYVLLHVGPVTHVLRDTLAALEVRCAARDFIRISRSALVNLARVREIRHECGGPIMVLAGGHQLSITRGLREIVARIEAP